MRSFLKPGTTSFLTGVAARPNRATGATTKSLVTGITSSAAATTPPPSYYRLSSSSLLRQCATLPQQEQPQQQPRKIERASRSQRPEAAPTSSSSPTPSATPESTPTAVVSSGPPPANNPTAADSVRVSDSAFNQINTVNAREGFKNADRFLRLAIESGGCQGFVYKFDFDSQIDEEEDVVFQAAGDDPARFVVDKFSLTKLQGATIDYHIELKGSAFVVVGNELVDHSCACAMSFALKNKK